MDQEANSLPRQKGQPEYPVGTVAFYGPDDQLTTKIAAPVIRQEGAEPVLKRWVGHRTFAMTDRYFGIAAT